MDVLSQPLATLAAGLLVVLGAGIVRGFSGFGFSAITVAGFSLFTSPAAIVPVALVLEVLASISLLGTALRGADRHWLRWLVAGTALFVPLGLLLLVWLPETALRLAVGAALLATAGLLRTFGDWSVAPGTTMRALTGVTSGVMNGVAASGGVAAAMLMTAARLPATALRATMITYLLFAGPYTLLCAALIGGGGVASESGGALLSLHTLVSAAIYAPAMVLGIWIGKNAFSGTDPLRYRRFVLNLLIVLSASGVARALFDLLRP